MQCSVSRLVEVMKVIRAQAHRRYKQMRPSSQMAQVNKNLNCIKCTQTQLQSQRNFLQHTVRMSIVVG